MEKRRGDEYHSWSHRIFYLPFTCKVKAVRSGIWHHPKCGGQSGSPTPPQIHAHARGAAPTWTRGPASPHLSSLRRGHPAPAQPLGDSSNLGKRGCQGQRPRWRWRAPTLAVQTPSPTQVQRLYPVAVQGLTLWRRCVGPAPAQGELPGQGGAMLGVGWGRRTGPCKAQGAGAARPADGRGPGDMAGVRKRVPQPCPVRAMAKTGWLVPFTLWPEATATRWGAPVSGPRSRSLPGQPPAHRACCELQKRCPLLLSLLLPVDICQNQYWFCTLKTCC